MKQGIGSWITQKNFIRGEKKLLKGLKWNYREEEKQTRYEKEEKISEMKMVSLITKGLGD